MGKFLNVYTSQVHKTPKGAHTAKKRSRGELLPALKITKGPPKPIKLSPLHMKETPMSRYSIASKAYGGSILSTKHSIVRRSPARPKNRANRSDFVSPNRFADELTSQGSYSPVSRKKTSPGKSSSRSPPKSRSPKRRGYLPDIIKKHKQRKQQTSASRSLERRAASARSSGELSSELLAQLREDNEDSQSQQEDARKASRRAINLMMKDIQNKQKPIWVPGGREGQGRIFHENYLAMHGGRPTMPLKSSNL